MKKITKIFITLFTINLFLNTGFAYYYNENFQYPKSIKINTFAEKLSYYEYWMKIWEFSISSWNKRNQTPWWRFKITNKSPMMWSKTAEKWMPNWMEFYQWKYWIHGLPLDKKYQQIKTEEEVLWKSAWWWCVRVWKTNIKKLYEWADYWTTVLVAYDLEEYKNKTEEKIIEKIAKKEEEIEKKNIEKIVEKEEKIVEKNTEKNEIILLKWEWVIKKYFLNINEKKYKEAYEIKENVNYSFWLFEQIYFWLKIENIRVKKLENNKFLTKVDIYKNWNILRKNIKSIFFISWDKISKSYVLK